MFSVLILVSGSYLLGSIPTAIITGKILKDIDIRDYGSGNAGATNVFRVLGWKAGLVVLSIDMLKGFLAVWLLPGLIPGLWQNTEHRIYWQIAAGIIAVLGHIWTIFAGFRGGKGVGTAAGVFLGLQPVPVLICMFLFIIVVAKTRFVSLGSISSASLLPLILIINKFFLQLEVPVAMLILSLLLVLLIVFTHRQNINRLIHGREHKLTFGQKASMP
jgi:acyl phosphate:glycerol-3-phosphate acyltransferase